MRSIYKFSHLGVRLPLSFAIVAAVILSTVGVQAANWKGQGGNNLFSTKANWGPGVGPRDNYTGSGQDLDFEVAPGIVYNDFSNGNFEYLHFKVGGFTLTGNAFNFASMSFSGDTVISAPAIKRDPSPSSYWMIIGNSASARFTASLTNTNAGENILISGGRLIFSGTGGAIISPSASMHFLGSQFMLDNSTATNPNRVDDDLDLFMAMGSTLELKGNPVSTAALSETIKSVNFRDSGIITVVGNGASADSSLTLGSAASTGLLLFHSLGSSDEVLGSASNGPKIKLNNVGTSNFLGARQIYLSGSYETGLYEFAAHISSRGVVSATTSTNLSTAGAVDHVMLSSPSSLNSNVTVSSLALNDVSLGGTGTVSVKNILLARDNVISANVNFGNSAASITVASFDPALASTSGTNADISEFSGNIIGTGSLSIVGRIPSRGNTVPPIQDLSASRVVVTSDASYSGDISISAATLQLIGNGRLSHVSQIKILDGTLALGGGNVSRLSASTDIQLESSPYAQIGDGLYPVSSDWTRLNLVASGPIPTVQSVGNVTVKNGANLIMDSSASAAGARLNLASLTVDGSNTGSSPNNLGIDFYGNNNTIAISSPLSLKKWVNLTIDTHGGSGNVLETPVFQSFDDGSLPLPGELKQKITFRGSLDIAGDLKILAGIVTFDLAAYPPDTMNIDGDFTMGEWCALYASLPQMDKPIFFVDGDVTLDGAVSLWLTPWRETLLFEYTGTFTDNGFYKRENQEFIVDELNKKVFVIDKTLPVPEPSIVGLLIISTALLLPISRSALLPRRFLTRR